MFSISRCLPFKTWSPAKALWLKYSFSLTTLPQTERSKREGSINCFLPFIKFLTVKNSSFSLHGSLNPLKLEQETAPGQIWRRPRQPSLRMARRMGDDGLGFSFGQSLLLSAFLPIQSIERCLDSQRRRLFPFQLSSFLHLVLSDRDALVRTSGSFQKDSWILCLQLGGWEEGVIFCVMKSGCRKGVTEWVTPTTQALSGWRQLWKQVRQVTFF